MPVNTPKSSVDLARARVLETCKRQLHLRLKKARLPKEAVTFGILIYGLCYEIYIVYFTDGYYPYERVSVGLLSTSHKTYDCTEKALKDLVQLNESMKMSLPAESNKEGEEFTLVNKDFLLPTASYSTIVRYV